ncbi:MAG: glutamate--cysteine ligase, partial [Pseudomonadota bacterium]
LLERAELLEADNNYLVAAHSGRAPDLELRRNGEPVRLEHWAEEILQAVEAVAETMSGSDGPHARSVREQRQVVQGHTETISARLLREMESAQQSFIEFTNNLSHTHREHWLGLPLMPEARFDLLRHEVTESLQKQQSIEESPQSSFEDYLRSYYAVKPD